MLFTDVAHASALKSHAATSRMMHVVRMRKGNRKNPAINTFFNTFGCIHFEFCTWIIALMRCCLRDWWEKLITGFLQSLFCKKKKERKHLQSLPHDEKTKPSSWWSLLLIIAWLLKTVWRYRGRADLIVRSLFLLISFTAPSGRHRQTKNRLPCGSCFNQLPDYSNKVGSTSFAGLKQFPLCDKFISSALGFESTQMFSIWKLAITVTPEGSIWSHIRAWVVTQECAEGTGTMMHAWWTAL